MADFSFRRFVRNVACAAAATVAALLIAQTRAAPLESYGHLPSIAQAALSPDGTRVALLRTTNEDRSVAILSLPDMKPLRMLPVKDAKVRRVGWADPDHLMVFVSATTGLRGYASEWTKVYVYDLPRNRWIVIPEDVKLGNLPASLGAFYRIVEAIFGDVTIRQINGRTNLFFKTYLFLPRDLPGFIRSMQRTESELVQPFLDLMDADVDPTRLLPAFEVNKARPLPVQVQVELDSGSAKLSRLGAEGTLEWLVDGAGKVVAGQRYSEADRQWSLSVLREGRLRQVAGGTASIDFPRLLGFGAAADTVLMSSGDIDDPTWRFLSLKDGSTVSRPAGETAFGEPIFERKTGRLIGASHLDDSLRLTLLDPALQGRWNSIVSGFKGCHVKLASATDDFSRFVILVDGPGCGYQYQLVDETHRTVRVGDVYDGVTESLEVRRVSYSAADGLPIEAYLTLPRGREAKGLPLVVLVHGGPAARDTADFDWWSQSLADQGYAVFRPNYRGSSVSRRLLIAGFGEFGRKMQTDLSDGVRYLIREGIVDPMRVCIVGGSYGGYAALAGASIDTGVYRCAVSVAGLSDLKAYLRWVDERHDERENRAQRFWDRFMGVTGPSDPLLDRISPIKHVDAIDVPILLIHGRDDTVVPYEQSETMYDALRHARKDVEFVKLKREDHWMSRSETRLQMLQATVAFLLKHNPLP